jgi:hypothetical protein
MLLPQFVPPPENLLSDHSFGDSSARNQWLLRKKSRWNIEISQRFQTLFTQRLGGFSGFSVIGEATQKRIKDISDSILSEMNRRFLNDKFQWRFIPSLTAVSHGKPTLAAEIGFACVCDGGRYLATDGFSLFGPYDTLVMSIFSTSKSQFTPVFSTAAFTEDVERLYSAKMQGVHSISGRKLSAYFGFSDHVAQQLRFSPDPHLSLVLVDEGKISLSASLARDEGTVRASVELDPSTGGVYLNTMPPPISF